MLRTLRNRLILSHVLPLLIIIPLVGVALIYALETQFIVPGLADEVQEDAQLLAQLVTHHGEVWEDSAAAQGLLGEGIESPDKRVMLLTPSGELLASNDAADGERIGVRLADAEWQEVTAQQPSYFSHLDGAMGADVIDVFFPVLNAAGEVQGFVRVSQRYATLGEDLLQVRDLVSTILIFALLGGTALGLLLATSIGKPLRRVTDAVYELAQGQDGDLLPERGPEEVRRLLEAVNHLAERRRDLEIARRQLVANLVHELGRPLGALRLALEALQQGAADDRELRDEFLQGMDQGMARLEVLVDDLSGLHDEVLGGLELNYQELRLDEWLPVSLQPWRVAAQEKRLRWELAIEPGMSSVMVDPVRLAQAVGNLTANAIKYTPAGGTVTVTAGHEQADGWIWICIGDTGPGIPQEEHEAIFAPFFRGSQERRIKQGMGLGLGIARQYILAHGGRLELESDPGKGSRFTIWLPAEPNSQAARGHNSPS